MNEQRAYTPDGRPLTVAAIIPHPNGLAEVLMSGRVGAAEHAWFWIGGHVRVGEGPEQAALRELDEELEVDDPRAVRVMGAIDTYVDVSSHFGDRFRRGYRVHYVLVALGSLRVRVKDREELTAVAWKPVSQVAAAVNSLPAEVSQAAVRFAREAVAHWAGASSTTEPSVASCYIVEAGRLFMTKRRIPEGSFEWAAVSGQIEADETPELAAIREARDEVGLEIEVVRRLGERVQPATGRHLIYMAGRVVSGSPAIVDHEENTKWDWADLETVKARWANLQGGIFPPVLAYLESVMRDHQRVGKDRASGPE